MNSSEVSDHAFETIEEGFSTTRSYTINEQIHAALTGPFGDVSPVHVDDTLARSRGFSKKVMHGAILNGFLSHFIGVHFPGKSALLQSVNIQFKAPSYLGEGIRIDAKVIQKVQAMRVVVLDVRFTNTTQGLLVATAKVQVGVAS